VIHPGKQIADTSWKDTVQNARKTSPGIFSNYFADQGNGRIVGLYRTHTWNEQVTKPLLNNILYAKNLTNKAAANGNTSSDSTLAPPKWVPILVPSIGIQNNTQEISLAFNAQIQIQTFIPAYIAVGGEGMWHAVRDLYFGISPQAVLEIFAFENSTVDIPLWVTWVTNGYINTDIGYNDAGVTRLKCAVIPQFFANVDTSDKNNIKYLRYSAATLGLMFSHGFPLTKYFSCIVKTDNYYKILSDKNFIDTKGLLKGLSDQYYNLSAGASFVFPLWRQINGGPVYADALYGEVGYDFSIYASTPNLGGRLERAFLDPSFEDNHIYPQHLVTAGTRLGFFKSYSFARTLSAKVLWDVMRNDVGVNFSIGF
jgi:hypothetical protein